MDSNAGALLNSSNVDSNGNVQAQELNLYGELDTPVINEAEAEVEAKAENEKRAEEVKPKEDPFSKRFASLSKKEKALRQREQQVNARMAELEAKMAAMSAPKAEPAKDPFDVQFKRDPLKALADAGMPYEKLTDLVLNNGKLPIEDQLRMMKEEFESKSKSEVEQLRKQIEEREQAQLKEREIMAVNNFKHSIDDFIKESPDYNILSDLGGAELVYEKIEEHYNQHGKVLEIKEAADLLKSDLMEKAKLLFEKLGLSSQAKPSSKQPEQKKSNSAPTLSNKASAVTSGSLKPNMSLEEAKRAAADLLKWND